MAYTVGYEHTQASVNGEPRRYTLRATQVYRREDGEWKVAHRHADTRRSPGVVGQAGRSGGLKSPFALRIAFGAFAPPGLI